MRVILMPCAEYLVDRVFGDENAARSSARDCAGLSTSMIFEPVASFSRPLKLRDTLKPGGAVSEMVLPGIRTTCCAPAERGSATASVALASSATIVARVGFMLVLRSPPARRAVR